MERVGNTRDNKYLESRLGLLFDYHFANISRPNTIIIKFGRKCFKRLGTIRRTNVSGDRFDTLILINGHFSNPIIPEFVIDATIAHELAHYAHGIASPHPRKYKYPHRGGIIDIELETRGLDQLIKKENNWLQLYWKLLIKQANTDSSKALAILAGVDRLEISA